MESRVDRVLSVVLTLAAVAMSVAIVRREFAPAPAQASSSPQASPTLVNNWLPILAHGTRIGPANAQVVVAEFGDLECPFCKRFYENVYRSVEKQFAGQVALVYVDFPITGHRFARPAARAAECAKTIGKFGEFIAAIYKKQDSLGLKTWESYGYDAGITDTTAFRHCAAATTAMPFFDSAAAFGEKMGVRSTPTVVVNGWRFPSAPADSTLALTIAKLLKGEEPFVARAAKAP